MNNYLLAIILADGMLWLRSSLGKFPPDKFINGLGGTLQKFASNNPHSWYKEFLQTTAIPNSSIFGFLTFWGEFLIALSLVLGSLYLLLKMGKSKLVVNLLVLGLFGGAFLNLTFWFASGWMSPSTDGLNLLMFITELVAFIYVIRLAKK